MLFGVRSAYPLWNRSLEPELHRWESSPNHRLNMECFKCTGYYGTEVSVVLDALEGEKSFYINVPRDDICVDL